MKICSKNKYRITKILIFVRISYLTMEAQLVAWLYSLGRLWISFKTSSFEIWAIVKSIWFLFLEYFSADVWLILKMFVSKSGPTFTKKIVHMIGYIFWIIYNLSINIEYWVLSTKLMTVTHEISLIFFFLLENTCA